MHSASFLKDLAIVLSVAGLTTLLFQRLRQPVVLGYLVAGLIIGPHVPVPLVADREVVQTLSELGVTLLMFSIGVEFDFRKLVRIIPSAGLVALLEVGLLVWLGYIAGRLLGWSARPSLFVGAVVAISSTTIVARVFEEQKIADARREIVFGVLIVEDLIAILLLATLTTIAAGAGLSGTAIARVSTQLMGFLVGLLAIGVLVVPRLVRAVIRLHRPETTVVTSVGLCFGLAALAARFGFSVALGSFVAGALVAESGQSRIVEKLIHPIRDMFAAIFFVAVGMTIDPAALLEHWRSIAVLTVLVVVGKALGVGIGVFLTGAGFRTAVQAALSLAQIGEFSFIIASVAPKSVRAVLYPVAVGVSALTTLLSPSLIRHSDRVATLLDRALPRRIQTFVTLYGSWIENLRSAPRVQTLGARIRRAGGFLLLDGAVLAIILIGGSLSSRRLVRALETRLGLAGDMALALVVLAGAVLAGPFLLGLVRTARTLGQSLARVALPEEAEGRVDLAAAPRKMLIVTLQLAGVLTVGLLLLAVTQPFLPPIYTAVVLTLLLVALGFSFWRTATDLQGHVRAGVHVVIEALAKHHPTPAPAEKSHAHGRADDTLSDVRTLLPGMGEPVAVEVPVGSRTIGNTLRQLNLRGLTGASVLAIRRGNQVLVPTGHEKIEPGDVLAMMGTHDAIDAAREIVESLD